MYDAYTACKLYLHFTAYRLLIDTCSLLAIKYNNGGLSMKTFYPVKTLNQLRPLLIGFRKVSGLTQKEVSERLGVTQQTYARLEANPASASIERLFRVFSVLGVEINLSSVSSSDIEPTEKHVNFINSPARREKW